MERWIRPNGFDRLPKVELVPYPASPNKLKSIIDDTMDYLSFGACKAEKLLENGINGVNRVNAAGFLFYYHSLQENHLAPFTVTTRSELDRASGGLMGRASYQNDLRPAREFGGWVYGEPACWISPLRITTTLTKPKYINGIPVLTSNNWVSQFILI